MESASETVEPLAPALAGNWARRRPAAGIRDVLGRVQFVLAVYLASRVLLFAVAIVNGQLRHRSLLDELSNWDGRWYRSIANLGHHGALHRWMGALVGAGFYPHHVFHAQTNLGFFPLYPLFMWVVSQPVHWITGHGAIWSITVSGVAISLVGGFAATLLVQRLATGWWGPQTARRVVVLFCLFPGSVIFSMVYAEGVVLPLAFGCILALQRRRWVLAGTLAGLATACEPEAAVLILVCGAAAARELLRDRATRYRWRSLIAPALAASGIVAVGAFMWEWTGTPFATFTTQHYGWGERTDPFALIHLVTRFASQISFTHFDHPTINLNYPVGMLGVVVLIAGIAMLARAPSQISLEAWAWTLGISLLMVTSEYVPPNPRLLITAFPVVVVYADRIRGRSFNWLIAGNVALLAGLSALTFYKVTLRP